MQNSKLVSALKTLDKKEFRRFGEFVNSPYYNKNENISGLLKELSHFYPEFKSNSLTDEALFDKLFPALKFNYHKLRNLFSELFELYIYFLKLIAFEKTGIEADIDLLSELHARKQDVPYAQAEKKITKTLESSKVKDEQYFYLKHKLDRVNTSHFKFEKSKYSFNSIQTEFDSFFQYAIVGMLRHYSKMLHNRNHGNITFDMKMFNQVLEYIKDKEFEESPSCRIYKQIILLELYRKEEDYKKLLNLKKKFEDNISIEDQYYVLLVLNSFAVHMLKLGNESYYKDRFRALKEIVERNFFSSETLFPNFISTFTSACMAGEFKWAENFRESYKSGILPKEEDYNTITYCDAFLAYRKKEYAKALDLFAKTNFKLFLFKVMVKSYVLRIYYEEGLHEQTLSAIDAFRHYLKSEQLITVDQKEAHYEFLKYITALSNIKLEYNKKKDFPKVMELKNRVGKMKSNSLGIKNWLLEKILDLEENPAPHLASN